MKKLRLTAAAILFIVFAAAVTAGVKALFFPPAAQVPATAEMIQPEKLFAGAENHYRFTVTLPLTAKITDAVFIGEKSIASPPEITFMRYLGDRAKWLISGSFRVMETGKFSDGAIALTIGSNGENFLVKLPELDISAADARKNLAIVPAPVSPPDERRNIYFVLISAALILAVALGVIFMLKRKRSQPPLSPAEYALQTIARNNQLAQNGKISFEKAVAVLSDILREYLEKRFDLPMRRTTTDEFIRELNRNSHNALSAEAKVFLTAVMNRADIVKFAGGTVDRIQLDQLSFDAAEMIKNTENLITEEKQC